MRSRLVIGRAMSLGAWSVASVTVALIVSSQVVSCDDDVSRVDTLYERYSYPFKERFIDLLDIITSHRETTGVHVSNTCKGDLRVFSHALKSGHDEALAMLDSFTHPRSGQETGVIIDMGHHSLCESVHLNGRASVQHLLSAVYSAPSVDQVQQQSPGIHNSSSWTHQLIWHSVDIHYLPRIFAICLPSSCTANEVKSVLESSYFTHLTDPLTLTLLVTHDITPLERMVKMMICAALLILLALNVMGTALSAIGNSSLSSFDVVSNFKLLMKPPSKSSTQFVAKFKVFYIVVANVSHLIVPITYHSLFTMMRPLHMTLVESETARSLFGSFSILICLNFIVSSSLSIISWYPILSRRELSFFQFALTRALRSIPVVLFMTCVLIVSSDLSPKNPMMRTWLSDTSLNCLHNGWYELTFVSNFADVNSLCHRVSWFTSADMQLYSCFFLLSVHLCKSQDHERTIRFMIPMVTSLALLSTFPSSTFITLWIKLMHHGLYFFEDPMKYIKIYFNPVQYAMSYAAGLYLGHLMSTGHQWSKERARTIYISSCCLYACTVLSFLFNSHDEWTLAVMQLVRRVSFTGAVCAIFFCHWSTCDLKDTHVTMSGYICTIVSRMQYPIFLIHPIVITYFSLLLEYQFYTYQQLFLMIYPAQVVLSLLLAFIVHLTVESPLAIILTSSLKSKVRRETSDK